MRLTEKPCPGCGRPMNRFSQRAKCSRCRGTNHKPLPEGAHYIRQRSLGSDVPLPCPELVNGGLLIPREIFDRMGAYEGDVGPAQRGYGTRKGG